MLAERELGMSDTASVQLSAFDQLPRRGGDSTSAPLGNTPLHAASAQIPAEMPLDVPADVTPPLATPARRHPAGPIRTLKPQHEQEPPTVFQRRIVVGAVMCVAAFALVGIRLVDVTLLRAGPHPVTADGNPVITRADLTDRQWRTARA